MKEEFDAYIVFSNTIVKSNDNNAKWARNLVQHLSIISQKIKKGSANVGSNIDEDKDVTFESILSKSKCLIIQYPSDESSKISDEALNQNRIIKLTTAPVSTETKLKDAPEIVFFEITPNNTTPVSLPASSPDYWQKLTDLAYQIKSIADTQNKEKQSEKPAIFLAETTPDQYYHRDVILRELTQFGFRIFPEKPISTEYSSLKEELFLYLNKSILSIHIIGNQYGNNINGAEISKIEAQNTVAAEYCSSKDNPKLSRLIWISPELKTTDARQEKLIESLSKNPKELIGGEIIQTPLEVLKTIIGRQLKENKASDLSNKSKQNVYVIYNYQETEAVKPLIKELEAKSISIITSSSSLKGANAIQSHRKNLVNNDGVIIYYNTTNPFWLSSKVKDLIKAPGYGRIKPFTAKALFVGKNTNITNDINISDIQVIEEGSSKQNKDLETFINKILENKNE